MDTFLFLLVVVLGIAGYFVVKGYNGLRLFSEGIREAWSNIGVSSKKQVSLINQLIEVVKGYQESEKLVMLKVSEDTNSAMAVAQLHQQAGVVMSTISGMAQRFPELKSNQQYQQLIASMQVCETELEQARTEYNARVRGYNAMRSSIPTVFFAQTLGFGVAPYLEFSDQNLQTNAGAINSFNSDQDGERLNALLGAAGESAKRLGGKAIAGGAVLATKAIEGGKVLAEQAQHKVQELRDQREQAAQADAPPPEATAQDEAAGDRPPT